MGSFIKSTLKTCSITKLFYVVVTCILHATRLLCSHVLSFGTEINQILENSMKVENKNRTDDDMEKNTC
jgi:hypothetical protein